MRKYLLIVLCLAVVAFGINKKYWRPQVNTVGLIGHWKFHEGTAFDYSLQGNSGTLTGTTLAYKYPGLDLAGSDEHVVISDDVIFSPILTPLTISAWLNMDDATSFVIASKFSGSTREWLFSTLVSDRLRFQVYDETNDKSVARFRSTAITGFQGLWIHVVGTYSGGTTDASIKLYLNGVRVDTSDTGSGSFVSCRDTANAVDIGNSDSDYANGRIDDVMIFNVEKSATEVLSIYSSQRYRYSR